MLVQVLPMQVPAFWKHIQFAAVKSDDIANQYVEKYSINLLHDLLSGDKSCLYAEEGGEITFIVIFSISVEPLTEIKYLLVNNIYSFKHHDDELWQQVCSDIMAIAKKESCGALGVDTVNPRAIQVTNLLGFKLFTQRYYKFI